MENAGSSSIEYFGHDASGHEVSLGSFAIPTGASGQPEFLGVLFDNPMVTDVKLTVGTNSLFTTYFGGSGFQSFGAENLAANDLVVTDDFVFAEPTVASPVPEPSSYALMVAGLGLLGFIARRKIQGPDQI